MLQTCMVWTILKLPISTPPVHFFGHRYCTSVMSCRKKTSYLWRVAVFFIVSKNTDRLKIIGLATLMNYVANLI